MERAFVYDSDDETLGGGESEFGHGAQGKGAAMYCDDWVLLGSPFGL